MPMLIDVADRLARVPLPRSRTHAVRERAHASQHPVHLGHDVLAIDDQRRPFGHAQRHVQHRAVLGDVDAVATKHGVDALAQPALGRQLQQEAQRLVGDAVLRVVEVQPGRLEREALRTPGVAREQLAQVAAGDLPLVRLQGLPGRVLPRRRTHRGHDFTRILRVMLSSQRLCPSSW